ncbi:MAG: glycosyltransferase family 2 protein [Bacteroidales bacterium]|nr:glycosyltransferase family 2 protein [Bacteroidales bacterium]
MHSSPLLTAVIITKNEERNIGRCLESIQMIADEIIVVDSYSEDSTEAICMQFKHLRFYSKEWKGYSETKNYGNSLASGNYILSIDADEALSPELARNIQHALKGNSSIGAYSFNRLTNFCGKWIHHCGWYPDRKVRLWRNGLAHWEGTIHERLVISGKPGIRHLKGDLLHYSYYHLEEYYSKTRKYAEMVARDRFRRGKRSPALKLFLSPLSCFISGYLLKGGFLDGRSGWIICTTSARVTYHKYATARKFFKAGTDL